jgi:hypothetical protein
MSSTSLFVTRKSSVIPTGVRPSALGWSNGVEEPAVRLLRQTACVVGRSVSLAAAFGILLLWTGLAGAQTLVPQTDAQKELETITASLANGSVATIDILHMPDEVETLSSAAAAASPEQDEAQGKATLSCACRPIT